MRLRVSQAAADDLKDIWLYTVEHWSVEQADRYLGMILDGFDIILYDPAVGKDFSLVREGYFGLKVGSHLIFYRLDGTGVGIEIIRVLHEQMDVENRLKP